MTTVHPAQQTPLHPSPPPVTHHRPGWSAGRVVALVVSVLTMLVGLAFIALGLVILAVDSDKRDGDFLTSDETSLATNGYAVTADGDRHRRAAVGLAVRQGAAACHRLRPRRRGVRRRCPR